MKVGDLVELSAVGKKARWYRAFQDRLGVVIEHGCESHAAHQPHMDWQVGWCLETGAIKMRRMHRREIKHARTKK